MSSGNWTKKQTLCWECENACGGCSWSEIDPETGRPRFEPVPGWTAEESSLHMSHGRDMKSYHITDCPQFKGDRSKTRRKKMSEADKEIFLENMAFFFRRLNEVGRGKVD